MKNLDLFSLGGLNDTRTSAPLAEKMRPQNLSEYIGQPHLMGEGCLLRRAIEEDNLFSMIFWGPPGSGKTTLARVLASETQSKFISFSAVLSGVKERDGVKILVREIEVDSPKDLRDYVDRIKEKLGSGILLLGSKKGDKVMLICAVTEDLTGRFHAGDIISRLSEIVGGKGGGRPDMAQGGGNRPEELNRALEALFEIISGSSPN